MSTDKRLDAASIFRDAATAEFYGFCLFGETEQVDYYSFGPSEIGDFACLVRTSDDTYEPRRFEETRKFSHPQMVPQVVRIFHSSEWVARDTKRTHIERALEQGGRAFAEKINQAFVGVLLVAAPAEIQAQPNEDLDALLARGSDFLGGQGFKADRLLFPIDLKDRMLVQRVIISDNKSSNSHYVGKTATGLSAFWSRELPSDTALMLDSSAGVAITQGTEPLFDVAVRNFVLSAHGLRYLNPIIRNARAVIVLKDVDQAIGCRIDSGITIAMGDAEKFLGNIREAIEASSIEDEFKEVALYDLEQAQRAYRARAFKACVIMLGAVLEGLTLGTLRRPVTLNVMRNDHGFPGGIARSLGGLHRPEYASDSVLADAIADRLSFEEYRLLIHRYIPDIEPLQVEGIQNFRNAVHPWRAIQVPTAFADYDEARAMRHLSSLSILARHISSWTP